MSSENSSNSAVIGGRPVQETNVDYLPSTGRNIPQTVALPPPPGITEKTVQVSLHVIKGPEPFLIWYLVLAWFSCTLNSSYLFTLLTPPNLPYSTGYCFECFFYLLG